MIITNSDTNLQLKGSYTIMNYHKYFQFFLLASILLGTCKKNSKNKEQIVIAQPTKNLTIPNFWEDPKISEFGREEPRADFKPMETESAAVTNQYKSSKFYQSLNGFWKYQYFYGPDFVPSNIEKSNVYSSWLDISMPGFAELKGMGKPIFKYYGLPFKLDFPNVPHDTNTVLVLKKSFEIPANWNDRDIFSVFEGVSCAYFIYLNGELVGYNEDTKACSEYPLNKFLKTGINDLTLILIRWSDGSYFETHNMWSMTGLNRNAYLLARPKIRIKDYYAKTDLHGNQGEIKINAEILNQSSENKNLQLETKVVDNNNKIIYSSNTIRLNITSNNKNNSNIPITVKNVQAWSDEIPTTYRLILNLKNEQNEIIESASSLLAFTSISYKQDFVFNNKKIKIKGVNCHEFHPINGNILDKEWMDNDMDVMKLHNINAIRNNHYPFDAYWYETSLKFGLYVFDECNLDLSALTNSGVDLSNDSTLANTYLQRVRNTFERNKNCGNIIAWSLGYNLGNGQNAKLAFDYIKSRDEKRPISYVSSNQSYGDLDYLAQSKSGKPMLAYCLGTNQGNGLGGIVQKLAQVNYQSNFSGGFVEDFTDQCFYMKNKNGQLFFGYGGVFGENKSDSFLCSRGIFTSNKTPNPSAKLLAANYSYYDVVCKDPQKGILEITNLHKFYEGDNFNYFWAIDCNGDKLKEGKFDKLKFKTGEKKTVQIDIASVPKVAGKEYCISLTIEKIIKVKGMIRFLTERVDKFCLPFESGPKKDLSAFPDITFNQNESEIKIHTDQLDYIVNKSNGLISSWKVDNYQYLSSPISPIFYRAATDFDYLKNRITENNSWKAIWNEAKISNLNVIPDKSKIIVNQLVHFPSKPNVEASLQYVFYNSGDLILNLDLKNNDDKNVQPPRCAWYFEVSSSFGTVNWYGRGPYESYPDRKEGFQISLYKTSVTDFNVIKVRPQEMSNKTDTRWMDLASFDNHHITSIGLFTFDAKVLPYPYSELDGKYKYGIDLKPLKNNSVILGTEIWPLNEKEIFEMLWPVSKTIKTNIRLKAYKADHNTAFQESAFSLP